MNHALLLLTALFLAGCTAARQQDTADSTAERPVATTASTDASADAIVFLTLDIVADSTLGHSHVTLVRKDQVAGTLKRQQYPDPGESYLTVHVRNGDATLQSFNIDHPLYRHVEYMHTDSTLAHAHTHLDSARFSVRLHVRGNGNILHLDETIQSRTTPNIAIIPL